MCSGNKPIPTTLLCYYCLFVRRGMPLDVLGPGGNLERELGCGNTRSADTHAKEVW